METILIICPTYNSGRYLRETIESVRRQTYSNWELWIVDGGSSDDTEALVSRYSDDKRICFISFSEVRGPGAARVHALLNSTHEFIAFIDSDDLWHEDKLNIQFNRMKSSNLDFTYTNYSQIGKKHSSVFVWSEVSYASYFRLRSIANSSVMIRRKLVKECHYLSTYNGYAEDTALWLECLRLTKKAVLISNPLLKYRIHNQSRSKNFFMNARDVVKIYMTYHNKSLSKSVWLYGLCVMDVLLRNYVMANFNDKRVDI